MAASKSWVDPFDAEYPVHTALPEQSCPSCRAPLRRARAPVQMKTGDVAVCAECATLLSVGDGYRIEVMTIERLGALPESVREQLLALARQVARMRMGVTR